MSQDASARTSPSSGFVYTDAMRDRARRRIQKKLETEDTEQVFTNYMRVMFEAFTRRIEREQRTPVREATAS